MCRGFSRGFGDIPTCFRGLEVLKNAQGGFRGFKERARAFEWVSLVLGVLWRCLKGFKGRSREFHGIQRRSWVYQGLEGPSRWVQKLSKDSRGFLGYPNGFRAFQSAFGCFMCVLGSPKEFQGRRRRYHGVSSAFQGISGVFREFSGEFSSFSIPRAFQRALGGVRNISGFRRVRVGFRSFSGSFQGVSK